MAGVAHCGARFVMGRPYAYGTCLQLTLLAFYSSWYYNSWYGEWVFKTRWFARFAKSEGISDERLAEAIGRAERGLIDADLGGGLIKQRVARPGKGQSGGYRTLIAYRHGERAVFVFGFAKSDRDNIGSAHASELKAAAYDVLVLTPSEIATSLVAQALVEVPYGKKD